jgi:hypothetical protein
MTEREELARVLAAGLGFSWENLYQDKRDWTDDRGKRHDINTPYKSDYLDAADAILAWMKESGYVQMNNTEVIVSRKFFNLVSLLCELPRGFEFDNILANLSAQAPIAARVGPPPRPPSVEADPQRTKIRGG